MAFDEVSISSIPGSIYNANGQITNVNLLYIILYSLILYIYLLYFFKI